jgi:hypothetical protein
MTAKNNTMGTVSNLKSDVKGAAQKAAFSPFMDALTRLGYGVRGLIYVTMGFLAIGVTLGKGGALADQQGAIAAIGKQPAGMILLWLILFGLGSYSLWGIIRAVFDPLHKGHDLKGFITRIGFLFSAVSYALLMLPTYSYIKGAGSANQNGAQTQQFLTTIMEKPWGPWLVGVIGLVIVAVGLYQVVQGINSSFDKQFKSYAMTAKEVKIATQLGRLGTATRGLIFAIVGGLLCLSAYQSNPNQPIGIDSALNTLLRQPYGVYLLGLTALGLIAFGVYSILSAVWFRARR